jgi:hypothetical protein
VVNLVTPIVPHYSALYKGTFERNANIIKSSNNEILQVIFDFILTVRTTDHQVLGCFSGCSPTTSISTSFHIKESLSERVRYSLYLSGLNSANIVFFFCSGNGSIDPSAVKSALTAIVSRFLSDFLLFFHLSNIYFLFSLDLLVYRQ